MEYHIPTQADTVVVEEIVNRKLRNSMLWMVWGLLTTAIIGFMALTNSSWLRFAHSNFNIILLAEVAVVFLFSFRQYTASNTFLKAMFFLYSIMNGLTLTAIALHYSFEVVVYALTGAVAVFGSFAFLGVVVKKDLSGLGTFLMGAVIALLIASLIMMFFGASDFGLLVYSYIAVGIFSLFTMYDVYRIKRTIMEVSYEDESVLERVELIGALGLYLDFINIFINLLRIFGRR